uniref:Uncharacterized protein n=1 Tax=Oryza nivara TaxID=4536 RepID=A0A0E0HX10_ORYNI
MDSDDHPPEFIIHVVDDLAPPPPPPPPRAQPALVPPRILPLPPPAFHGAAVQRRRPRPPPRDEATNNRTLLFVFQVCMFTMMVINLSIAIYLTVHPSPEESIADERSGVRMTCVFIISAVHGVVERAVEKCRFERRDEAVPDAAARAELGRGPGARNGWERAIDEDELLDALDGEDLERAHEQALVLVHEAGGIGVGHADGKVFGVDKDERGGAPNLAPAGGERGSACGVLDGEAGDDPAESTSGRRLRRSTPSSGKSAERRAGDRHIGDGEVDVGEDGADGLVHILRDLAALPELGHGPLLHLPAPVAVVVVVAAAANVGGERGCTYPPEPPTRRTRPAPRPRIAALPPGPFRKKEREGYILGPCWSHLSQRDNLVFNHCFSFLFL